MNTEEIVARKRKVLAELRELLNEHGALKARAERVLARISELNGQMQIFEELEKEKSVDSHPGPKESVRLSPVPRSD